MVYRLHKATYKLRHVALSSLSSGKDDDFVHVHVHPPLTNGYFATIAIPISWLKYSVQ
jgi:hypothetical protein